MKRGVVIAVVALLVVAAGGLLFLSAMLRRGFSTHDDPSALEASMARRMRAWSVPSDLSDRSNPVKLTPEVLAEARAHFADHCASCHGNDGKGTDLGKRMFPRAPDLTLPATQSVSDGALFAVIENGIRMTGMPGFGTGTAASAHGSWTLVHFIRHLPEITPQELAEMRALNPKSPAEWARMQAGAAPAAPANAPPHGVAGHAH